jgi:hypothetical protein
LSIILLVTTEFASGSMLGFIRKETSRPAPPGFQLSSIIGPGSLVKVTAGCTNHNRRDRGIRPWPHHDQRPAPGSGPLREPLGEAPGCISSGGVTKPITPGSEMANFQYGKSYWYLRLVLGRVRPGQVACTHWQTEPF